MTTLAKIEPDRTQERQDDQHDRGGANQHDPGQRCIQPEQKRQQDQQGDHVQQRGHQLAGHELPDLVDLADPVHRLAGRMALEIIERQPDQPVEDVQAELGIGPDADHEDDQPAGIAQ